MSDRIVSREEREGGEVETEVDHGTLALPLRNGLAEKERIPPSLPSRSSRDRIHF